MTQRYLTARVFTVLSLSQRNILLHSDDPALPDGAGLHSFVPLPTFLDTFLQTSTNVPQDPNNARTTQTFWSNIYRTDIVTKSTIHSYP